MSQRAPPDDFTDSDASMQPSPILTPRALAVLVTITFFVFGATAQAAPSWQPPLRAGASSPQMFAYGVAMRPDGSSVVAWSRHDDTTDANGDSRLLAAIRPPHGAFGAPIVLDSTGAPSQIYVASDAAGDVIIVWGARYALFPAGSDTPSFRALPIGAGAFTLSPSGHAYVAGSGVDGVYETDWDIRTAAPPTPTEVAGLRPGSDGAFDESIAGNDTGDAVVLYREWVWGPKTDTTYLSSVRRSGIGGSWSTPAGLDSTSSDSSIFSLTSTTGLVSAMDTSGNTFAAWVNRDPNWQTLENAYAPAGGAFEAPDTSRAVFHVGSDDFYSAPKSGLILTDPAIGFDADDTAHLFYAQNANVPGNGWGSLREAVRPEGASSTGPDRVIESFDAFLGDRYGTPAYTKFSDGRQMVTVERETGVVAFIGRNGAWGDPAWVGFGCQEPSIAAGANGTAMVSCPVWSDSLTMWAAAYEEPAPVSPPVTGTTPPGSARLLPVAPPRNSVLGSDTVKRSSKPTIAKSGKPSVVHGKAQLGLKLRCPHTCTATISAGKMGHGRLKVTAGHYADIPLQLTQAAVARLRSARTLVLDVKIAVVTSSHAKSSFRRTVQLR